MYMVTVLYMKIYVALPIVANIKNESVLHWYSIRETADRDVQIILIIFLFLLLIEFLKPYFSEIEWGIKIARLYLEKSRDKYFVILLNL